MLNQQCTKLAQDGHRVDCAWNDWFAYIACAVVTAAAISGLYVLVLKTLRSVNLLPPPALTNSFCRDAKLEFLKENLPQEPSAVILGASVAWRNVASEEIVRQYPSARPVNMGFCGLQVNQTRFVANYFLDRYPGARDVLLLLDAYDMSMCGRTKARLFKPADVDEYFAAHGAAWGFYFRYFDPIALLRNVRVMTELRAGTRPFDPLVFTPYGDGPMAIDGARDDVDGPFDGIDPACAESLKSLVREITERGHNLVVATNPMGPKWFEDHDPAGKVHARLLRAIDDAVAGAGSVVVWDGERDARIDPDDLIDYMHLRWSAAERFTRQLVMATGFGASN